MSKPPKVRAGNPAPEGEIVAPGSVSRADFAEALRPLMGLLGLTPEGALCDGFLITTDSVRLLTTEPLIGVSPRPSSDSADDPCAIWVWPVDVPIIPRLDS